MSDAELSFLLQPLRSEPERSAILCDIDGTLAPITSEPDEAAVPGPARALLGCLAERYALVGCVSGRRALAAREMVGVEALVYVGNHGIELLAPGDAQPRADAEVAGQSERVRGFLSPGWESRLERAGLRLEDKGPIQSLHWREAPDHETAEREARALAEEARREGIEPRWGRKVLELRPAVQVDKGLATARLLAAGGIDRALFGGDDVTDLDAFRALRELRSDGGLEHAVCVGVSSEEEPRGLRGLSDVVVSGTPGFLAVLEALAAEA